MTPSEWWKNFSLGFELDISGTFIYNGLHTLHRMEVLYFEGDIFEIMYQLSVGLERLLKVCIILLEHGDATDTEALESSLITHSTIDLADRVIGHGQLRLAPTHRQFLTLLSEFYRHQRYGRYSLANISQTSAERKAFLSFLGKHLNVEVPPADSIFPLSNSDQIRKSVGRVVKKISQPVFEAIRDRARELKIYTYELRHGSKASKVFRAEDRLDFVDEDFIKRELILFLMHPDASGAHIRFLRSCDCLELDPGMAPDHIRALLNDRHLYQVDGEVEELYTEIENIGERLAILRAMDQVLHFDDSQDDEWDEDLTDGGH